MAFIKRSVGQIVSTLDDNDVQSFEENSFVCPTCGRDFVKNNNCYKKVCTCDVEFSESQN